MEEWFNVVYSDLTHPCSGCHFFKSLAIWDLYEFSGCALPLFSRPKFAKHLRGFVFLLFQTDFCALRATVLLK